MKLRNLLNLVFLLIVGQLLFACGSAEYYKFKAHKPEAYNKVIPAPAEEAKPSLTELALEAADEKAAKQEAEPVLEASTAATTVLTPKKVVKANIIKEAATAEVKTVTESEALEMAKERIATMTNAEKKELKKDLKEALKQSRGGSRTSIVEIILAILIPPLAVFLHDGIGTSFWINIILTLLFIVPGIIHALLVVTDSI